MSSQLAFEQDVWSLKSFRSETSVHKLWYLDDSYIIATHQKLQKALDYLLSDGIKRSGLHLSLSKCEIWWYHEPSDNIKEAYPSEVSQRYNDGTFVLNAPIGSHRFMEDSIVQKVKALDPLFQEVSALENTHVSFTLLKFCMGVCKVNYLLRVTPVQWTKSGAQVFDELVEKSIRHIVGGVLDTKIFRELQLPAEVKLNCQNPTLGLGLTSATTTAASTFLSSAASCNALVGKALGSRTPNELSAYLAAKFAYEAWSVQCKQESVLPFQAFSTERPPKQQTITALVHRKKSEELTPGSTRLQIMRNSMKLPEAKTWVNYTLVYGGNWDDSRGWGVRNGRRHGTTSTTV